MWFSLKNSTGSVAPEETRCSGWRWMWAWGDSCPKVVWASKGTTYNHCPRTDRLSKKANLGWLLCSRLYFLPLYFSFHVLPSFALFSSFIIKDNFEAASELTFLQAQLSRTVVIFPPHNLCSRSLIILELVYHPSFTCSLSNQCQSFCEHFPGPVEVSWCRKWLVSAF